VARAQSGDRLPVLPVDAHADLLENVMLPMDFAEMYDFDERPGRAMEMLEMVGLESFANKLPVLVSTGQQQLAAIARALACDPPLLVADEPTGNLDTKSARTRSSTCSRSCRAAARRLSW
jgi:ABC-type lipoprotein export system ATPase subunit